MRRIAILLLTLVPLTLGLAFAQGDRMLLRGGVNHDVFLGCLTCSRFDAESVTNPRGTHGSEHGYASIHNAHGIYGSRYSDTSVCNPYAQHPPLVVSEHGREIGYLTLNRFVEGAIRQPSLVGWLENDVCD